MGPYYPHESSRECFTFYVKLFIVLSHVTENTQSLQAIQETRYGINLYLEWMINAVSLDVIR